MLSEFFCRLHCTVSSSNTKTSLLFNSCLSRAFLNSSIRYVYHDHSLSTSPFLFFFLFFLFFLFLKMESELGNREDDEDYDDASEIALLL